VCLMNLVINLSKRCLYEISKRLNCLHLFILCYNPTARMKRGRRANMFIGRVFQRCYKKKDFYSIPHSGGKFSKIEDERMKRECGELLIYLFCFNVVCK
jgi:hypothetical protein